MLMASSSIKMICPRCFQTARITSRSTLLDCRRCRCEMVEVPSAYHNVNDGRTGKLRDPDKPASGC